MVEIMELSSTSSGPQGWSSLSQFLDCPARAMAARNAAQERGNVPWGLFPEEKKPVATLVGSIYGALVEAWLMGNPPSPREELLWGGEPLLRTHPLSVAEAWRLYDARVIQGWTKGKVIATQVDILIPADIFGLEITGNLDLVVEDEGKIWIGDLKTEGRADANLREKFSLRQQLYFYLLGYEIKTGIKPVGCFIDLAVKNKEVKFERFEYEGLTDKRFAWLRDSVERVKAGMASAKPTPSLSACIPYGRRCQFLIEGICSLF